MTKSKLRLILKIVLGIMVVVAVVSLGAIGTILYQYNHSINQYQKLENYVTVEAPEKTGVTNVEKITVEDDASPEEPTTVSKITVDFDMDYAALKNINSDLMGWLYYEPLELSYPVVMDKGDDYYEHYSFENEKNVAGAIFTDYLCRADFNSFNTIIYGHNMRNGSMFGSLNKLLNDNSIIEENPYFYVFTEDEALMYEIVAAYYSQAGSRTYGLSLEYSLDEMQEYVDYIDSVAVYKNEKFFDSDVTEDTKICTLSTCHGVHSTSRTVIQGVLVAREPR